MSCAADNSAEAKIRGRILGAHRKSVAMRTNIHVCASRRADTGFPVRAFTVHRYINTFNCHSRQSFDLFATSRTMATRENDPIPKGQRQGLSRLDGLRERIAPTPSDSPRARAAETSRARIVRSRRRRRVRRAAILSAKADIRHRWHCGGDRGRFAERRNVYEFSIQQCTLPHRKHMRLAPFVLLRCRRAAASRASHLAG